MITWVSIQSGDAIIQYAAHRLDVDTIYRLIHKLDKYSAQHRSIFKYLM